MGLSRMILGVHFLDQVVFGYILGFITLAFVKEVIWPLFVQNVQNHKEKGKTSKQILKDLSVFFACNLSLFLINFAIFEYGVHNNWFDLDQEFLDNIQVCTKGKPIKTKNEIENENFTSSGFILIAFGVYCGVLFKIYKSPDFSLPWIYRILAKGVLLLVPVGVELMAISTSDGNPVPLMIFGSAIPSIINGFLIFANVETLILKFIGCKPK